MAKNYQSNDLWSRRQSIHGYAMDELRSVLQKSIRRGLVEEAVLAAYEIYITGSAAEDMLWRRLEIIATEDVGCGLVTAPVILEALNAQRLRMTDRGDRWMYSAHAVRLLSESKKDNSTMELANWTEQVVKRGERSVKIESYHLDMHTRRGVALGRDAWHWWTNGAALKNRLHNRRTVWGKYLNDLYKKSKVEAKPNSKSKTKGS